MVAKKAEGRGQKAEGRGQKAEGRGQRVEGGGVEGWRGGWDNNLTTNYSQIDIHYARFRT
jgi:hypothetical protein